MLRQSVAAANSRDTIMNEFDAAERLAAVQAAVMPSDLTMMGTARDAAFHSVYIVYSPLLRKIAIGRHRVPFEDADSLVHDVFATYLVSASTVRNLHSYF